MTNRKVKDLGIHPVLGFLLIALCFLGISLFLFYKTDFAAYIYILISLSFTASLSESNRNDFLKLNFSSLQYKWIRTVENLISSIPFLLFLIYKLQFLNALILIVTSILLGLNSIHSTLNITIPTPFYKKPFEFTVGFRNTFYLFILSYVLTFIAISVDNFNLGIFALLLIFLIVFSFYSKQEEAFFVWNYAMTPSQFILEKIKTAILFSSLLSLPIVVALSYFYYVNILAIIAFYCLCILFLITVITAKYAAYPREINLPEGIIFALCISFPPLLLFFTPFFYYRAKHRIQNYLI
jgi:hypothetical protein